MNGKELLFAIKSRRLSVKAAAPILGLSYSSLRRQTNGRSKVTRQTEILVGLFPAIDPRGDEAAPVALPMGGPGPGFAHVYVITAPSGACKIGIASDLAQRIIDLQTSTHETLKIGGSLFVTRQWAARVEAMAHAKFADRRIRGEWFAIDADEALAAIHEINADVRIQVGPVYQFKKRRLRRRVADPATNAAQ